MRTTVCQLTHESRGNGGGLRRGCGFASGRLLGATGPRMESYNWKAKLISPCLGAHEAQPIVFQKLNGPLLTTAPQSPSRWPELPKVGDVHYSTILIFNPNFASTPILLVLIHFADLLRRIAMNDIARLTVGISRFYEPTHMHVLRLDTLS